MHTNDYKQDVAVLPRNQHQTKNSEATHVHRSSAVLPQPSKKQWPNV